jgi:hypothetical protein
LYDYTGGRLATHTRLVGCSRTNANAPDIIPEVAKPVTALPQTKRVEVEARAQTRFPTAKIAREESMTGLAEKLPYIFPNMNWKDAAVNRL